jgi:hypothetical protein
MLLAGLGALLVAPLAEAANLVQNPGFETGDFTGWALAGDTDGSFVAVDCADAIQNSGNCAAIFGEPATTTLSQTFALSPSTAYTLTFSLQEFGTPTPTYPNSYSVAFNGTTLASASTVPDGGGIYTKYTYTLNSAASGNSGLLQFSFLNASGYYFVDDVSLTAAVPEPASYALMLGGLALLAVRRYGRKDS